MGIWFQILQILSAYFNAFTSLNKTSCKSSYIDYFNKNETVQQFNPEIFETWQLFSTLMKSDKTYKNKMKNISTRLKIEIVF